MRELERLTLEGMVALLVAVGGREVCGVVRALSEVCGCGRCAGWSGRVRRGFAGVDDLVDRRQQALRGWRSRASRPDSAPARRSFHRRRCRRPEVPGQAVVPTRDRVGVRASLGGLVRVVARGCRASAWQRRAGSDRTSLPTASGSGGVNCACEAAASLAANAVSSRWYSPTNWSTGFRFAKNGSSCASVGLASSRNSIGCRQPGVCLVEHRLEVVDDQPRVVGDLAPTSS